MPNSPQDAQLAVELAQLEENVRRLEAEDAAALADPGMIQEDRDGVRLLLQNARLAVEEARRAVERMRSGGYGVCRECGAAIGAERLDALPDATRCIDCQARLG